MIFKPYYCFETGCATYLFGCGSLGKCAVVDAHEDDVDAYVAFAASKDLFVGAVGRPDLPGHARENAGELHDSIHRKLLTLPDDVEVYPGHFSRSACGTGLSGKPSSTIAFEKRCNPLLSKSRASFVEALSVVPSKPMAMEQILRANRGR